MFLDVSSNGYWGGEGPSCMSCRRLINANEPTQELRFGHEHRLHGMNGIYHVECAKPYLSLMRAFNMLGRASG